MTQKTLNNCQPRGATKDTFASSLLPVWRHIHVAFIARSERWGLPTTSVFVLQHLWFFPEEDEPALLAAATLSPRQTITQALDTLEKRGLVTRSPHPVDRRRIKVSLTGEGEKIADDMLQDLLSFEARAMEKIPEEFRDNFVKMARVFADGLEL